MKNQAARLALAGVALLQGCGGGGGGGDGGGGGNPPPPTNTVITITDANVLEVGELAFGPPDTGLDVMLLLTRAAFELHQADLETQHYVCEAGGTVAFDAVDDDGTGSLTAGDTVRIAYDCEGLEGTLALEVATVTPEGGALVALDGDMLIDLDFPDGRLHGGGAMVFRATAIQLRWTGTGLAIAFDDGPGSEGIVNGRIEKVVTNDDNTLRYRVSIAGRVESSDLGGRFDFSTAEEFEGVEGAWPTSGRLVAEGQSGSDARFSPGTTSGFFEYQVDGGAPAEEDWTRISTGSLFSIDSGGGPVPPSSGEVLGRRIDLGSAGEDFVVDDQRGKIYVTVPDRNELAVISASTLAVERRVVVGSGPEGVSLSLDRSEAFIGLSGAGSIAIVDLDSFAVTPVDVATTLGTSNVFDVAETSPGILFISSGDTFGSGVRLNRATGQQTAVAAMNRSYTQIELIADPENGVLYAGDGWGISSQKVIKLDTTQETAPLIESSEQLNIQGTQRMKLSPDGSRLYLQGGQAVSTTNFSIIAQADAAFGLPAPADNGLNVLFAESPGELVVFSADDLLKVDEIHSDCQLDPVWRFGPSSVSGQWIMLGGPTVCVVDLDHPDVAPGTGDPGVPPTPVPERTVPVVDLDLGGTAFDVEFDSGRNLVYVSLTSTGEIVTLDAADPSIIDRDPVLSVPRGLDLSPDGGTLAIAFNANGNIGFKDLASGITERRDISPALNTLNASDVAWVADDKIFVSADGSGGKIVRTNRLDALDTQVVGDDRWISDRTQLLPSADGAFLYASHMGSQIFKLDMTDPAAPILFETEQTGGNIYGGDRLSLSPDGTNMVTGFGQVLRTTDFIQTGLMPGGTPLFSASGEEVFMASTQEAATLYRVDIATLVNREKITGNCSIEFPRRMAVNADENVIVTIGENRACLWFLDGLPTTAKAWSQKPYVCDAACLLRKVVRKSGAGVTPTRRVNAGSLTPP